MKMANVERGIGCLGKLKKTGQKTAHSTPSSHVYQVSLLEEWAGHSRKYQSPPIKHKITKPHRLVHTLQH